MFFCLPSTYQNRSLIFVVFYYFPFLLRPKNTFEYLNCFFSSTRQFCLPKKLIFVLTNKRRTFVIILKTYINIFRNTSTLFLRCVNFIQNNLLSDNLCDLLDRLLMQEKKGNFLIRNRDRVTKSSLSALRSEFSLSVKVTDQKVQHYKIEVIHSIHTAPNTDPTEEVGS